MTTRVLGIEKCTVMASASGVVFVEYFDKPIRLAAVERVAHEVYRTCGVQPHPAHPCPPLRWDHHVIRSEFLRLVLSRLKSATACVSFRFYSRRWRSSRISGVPSSPNLFRQRKNVSFVSLSVQKNSTMGVPLYACRSA